MKILVASNGMLVAPAYSFEFGAWEEKDVLNGVTVHKWKGEDDNGNIIMYAIDENRGAIDGTQPPAFSAYEVDTIPDGATVGKYLYIDGEFVENPDWVEPPKSDTERIAELEGETATLYEFTEELLYKQCLMELGITDEELNGEEV